MHTSAGEGEASAQLVNVCSLVARENIFKKRHPGAPRLCSLLCRFARTYGMMSNRVCAIKWGDSPR